MGTRGKKGKTYAETVRPHFSSSFNYYIRPLLLIVVNYTTTISDAQNSYASYKQLQEKLAAFKGYWK